MFVFLLKSRRAYAPYIEEEKEKQTAAEERGRVSQLVNRMLRRPYDGGRKHTSAFVLLILKTPSSSSSSAYNKRS